MRRLFEVKYLLRGDVFILQSPVAPSLELAMLLYLRKWKVQITNHDLSLNNTSSSFPPKLRARSESQTERVVTMVRVAEKSERDFGNAAAEGCQSQPAAAVAESGLVFSAPVL